MLDWVTSIFDSTSPGSDARPVADPELVQLLRENLGKCESAYRTSAQLCGQDCPDRLGGSRADFADKMLDLHRGLVVKIFIEVARHDHRWHPAEREVALVLLRHVWGVDVDPSHLAQALDNVAAHSEMLKWNALLGPLIELPPLSDQLGEVGALAVQIANLVAKADGRVSAKEAATIRNVQTIMERALEARRNRDNGKQRRAARVKIDRKITDLVRPRVAVRGSGSSETIKLDEDDESTDPAALTDAQRKEMLDAALTELDGLIGLQSIKKDIRELVDFLRFQTQRKQHGLPTTAISLHTVFQGNPGTGKTTIARILGHIFCGLGFLDRGHTVETDRSGLVGEYAGQTGPKTHERFDEAMEGVLFIDEAYSLVAERGDDPFGAEAVQALLKRMEDDRENVIVILAGYPQPMQRVLRSNPGLSSRFQRTLEFPDFTSRELLQIFHQFCKKNHYRLTQPTTQRLLVELQQRIDRKDEHFGNARLARNLFEKAIRRMATRIVDLAPLTREVLTTLEPEDFAERQ